MCESFSFVRLSSQTNQTLQTMQEKYLKFYYTFTTKEGEKVTLFDDIFFGERFGGKDDYSTGIGYCDGAVHKYLVDTGAINENTHVREYLKYCEEEMKLFNSLYYFALPYSEEENCTATIQFERE